MHRMTSDPLNLALRRYTGMALTNLTFGDVVNKVIKEHHGWETGIWEDAGEKLRVINELWGDCILTQIYLTWQWNLFN